MSLTHLPGFISLQTLIVKLTSEYKTDIKILRTRNKN